MADHNKPTLTSNYVDFVSELDGRLDDIALGLDPATTTATNVPTNAIRWSSSLSKWQKWNGTAWLDLSASFAININGTVGATTPATGAFTTLSATGNVTFTGGTINGTSIGATTASTGAFTNLSYTGTLTGGTGVINIGSGQLYKDASGNVGIGTSSPNRSNFGSSFRVQTIEGAAGGGCGVLELLTPSATGTDRFGELRFGNAATASLGLASFRAIRDGSDSSSAFQFLTSLNGAANERMRITSAGNVGIGTSSPGERLVVSGNAAVSGSGYLSLERNLTPTGAGSGTPSLQFRMVTTGTTYAAGSAIDMLSDGAWSSTSAPGILRFRTTASGSTALTERMRIDSAGNVLVGTTTAPTGAVNSIVPRYNANGSGGIIGGSLINTQFQIPLDAGTFTITLTGNIVFSGFLDVVVWGGFSALNREGYAAYKILWNRTTGSVTTITVQAPTNTGGTFTSSYTFTASKLNDNTLTIAIGKPSGAFYFVGLSGQIPDNRLLSISSSFA
jgi:hypothetical protein